MGFRGPEVQILSSRPKYFEGLRQFCRDPSLFVTTDFTTNAQLTPLRLAMSTTFSAPSWLPPIFGSRETARSFSPACRW